jgi:hypothetical protein
MNPAGTKSRTLGTVGSNWCCRRAGRACWWTLRPEPARHAPSGPFDPASSGCGQKSRQRSGPGFKRVEGDEFICRVRLRNRTRAEGHRGDAVGVENVRVGKPRYGRKPSRVPREPLNPGMVRRERE